MYKHNTLTDSNYSDMFQHELLQTKQKCFKNKFFLMYSMLMTKIPSNAVTVECVCSSIHYAFHIVLPYKLYPRPISA